MPKQNNKTIKIAENKKVNIFIHFLRFPHSRIIKKSQLANPRDRCDASILRF